VSTISDSDLIERALAVRARAYAPYSRYKVGCALVAGGEIFTGANVENASYGLTLCAERVAVAAAVVAGHREVDRVVVATDSSPPATPCGQCRQTLSEFSPDGGNMRIILVNPAGERSEHSLSELFPNTFSGDQLP
jgi:cytidine deaminase